MSTEAGGVVEESASSSSFVDDDNDDTVVVVVVADEPTISFFTVTSRQSLCSLFFRYCSVLGLSNKFLGYYSHS